MRNSFRNMWSILVALLMVCTMPPFGTYKAMASEEQVTEEAAAEEYAEEKPVAEEYIEEPDNNVPLSEEKPVTEDSTEGDQVSDEHGEEYLGDGNVDADADSLKEGESHEGFRIEGLEKSYPYTGYSITPSIRVYDGDYELIRDTDFTLICSNNVNVGNKAIVTVKFMGNYSRSPWQEFFEITGASIEDADIFDVEGIVSGKVQKLSPVIRYNGVILKKNTHYTLKYSDTSGEGVPYKTAGTWKITVVGKGNFAGSSATAREILHATEEQQISLNNKKVAVRLSAKSVSIDADSPVPTVTYMGSDLVADNDYSVEYGERKGAGNATIFIKGTGNFCDVRTVTYKVTKENISGLSRDNRLRVTVNNGEPVVIAKGGACPSCVLVEERSRDGLSWMPLTEGEDYSLTITNNKSAGKDGVVRVKGRGLYTGSVDVEFPVEKQSLTELEDRLYVGDVDEADAKKDAYKKVKYVAYDLDGKALKLNTDYTAKFEQIDRSTAKITLTGKGNYSSSISKEYKIITGKKSIQKAKIHYLEDGKEVKVFEYKRSPVVLDKSNIRLYLGKTEIPATGYEIVSCTENLNIGNAVVTVRGVDGYSGLVSFKYKIGAKALQIIPFPDKRVLFVGDSRTVDMFSGSAGRIAELKKDGMTVYATDGGAFKYFNQVLTTYGEDNFDILIVWMGANDRGKFDSYKEKYQQLLADGKTLIVCTVGPTDDDWIDKYDIADYTNTRMQAYNKALVSWANANNVTVIDLYSYIAKNVSISHDGIHYDPKPTTKIWNKIIYELCNREAAAELP